MTAHVCFALGAERYAVAVEQVREVAELGTVVPVPGAGPQVAGVRYLRGEILPVVRLHGLLGAPLGAVTRIVIVDDGDRRAGLAVDRTDDVEELAEPDAPGAPLTRGAVLHGGSVVGIVDVSAVLDVVAAQAGT
jgi:purine-binding chemotaxis protein CheW